MVVFSPVAQQPSSGIEDRLQAIEEILRRADQQTVIAIDLWYDEGCNCRSHSLKKQRFDAAFQETKLAEAATDGSSHVDSDRQIGLKHDAKVTSNSHRANQRTADTELPGVEMGTLSAGRAPKKLRLLRIKTESIRPHPLRDVLNSQLPPPPLQSNICPTYRVASRRRRKEMTSRGWQLTHQRLPYRAGITATPTPNPEGPRRRDDEPMMNLRRKKLIVCDRGDKNGASQAQSNEDHKSSPSARPARRGQRYQTLPKDQAGRATHDLQHQSPQ